MIRCHLGRLMGERKLKVADVARLTGMHRSSVNKLYRETAQKVNVQDIERLCRLFECQVGELFEYRDEP